MKKMNMGHKWLKIWLLSGVITGFILILFAIYFSPNFVVNNFSSDGILEYRTIITINILRVGISIAGILVLLLTVLFIKQPHLSNLLITKLDIGKIENGKIENYFVYILIVAIGFIYILNANFSIPFLYGGGDSFAHFSISKYSWKHPELLLSLWGKPFFTIVSSPFSQFDWFGMVIFNIICALLTAYFTYLYCKNLNLPFSWFSTILVAFTPIYFTHIPTGLTEPFFTLILVISAYLFLKKSYFSGSILVSFLPFVRSEGFLILPLFFSVLVLRKQFYKVPLLVAGLVLYSAIGYFFTRNILWVFTENYAYKHQAYTSGSFFHFFDKAAEIFGLPLLLLLIAGLFNVITTLIKKRERLLEEKVLLESFLIMTGSFAVYFFAHCLFWWKGVFSSAGLTRPMAGTIPGAVFTGMIGLQLLTARLSKLRFINSAFIAVLGLLIIIFTMNNYFLANKLPGERSLYTKASLWLKHNGYLNNKIYHSNPMLPFILKTDPFDKTKFGSIRSLNKRLPAKNIPMHSIIVWDAHFSPNEGQLPLKNLTNSDSLKLLKTFVPKKPMTVLNQYNYEIHIFIKQVD